MRAFITRAVLAITGVVTAVMPLASQTPSTQKPQFEVATVKPNTSYDQRVWLDTPPGGRIVATNLTLKNLMAVAYRLPESRIFGGPNWLTGDRWDLQAKAEDGIAAPTRPRDPAAVPPLMLMLQSLIEDRFRLRVHRETKELPVYDLLVAKGGLRMKLSEDQTPNPAPISPRPGGPIPRGVQIMGIGKIDGDAVPFRNFIAGLAQQLGRTVIDKTGLTGLYDIHLQWTPELAQGAAGPAGDAGQSVDSSSPSIFTAIEEQLGLRLQSGKGPVEVLVIDSVEKPTEN
jgi:uncharacterized protein (TIGR03435 family)